MNKSWLPILLLTILLFQPAASQRSLDIQRMRWPINSRYSDMGPTISANGKTMIFQSNRNGGAGSYDLYESLWTGSDWSQPVNLTSLNSKYYDGYPHITADGKTLYFSTNRHTFNSIDPDMDIWVSRKGINNSWTVPRPIDRLNTDDFEGMPSLSNDNQVIYFASDRGGGEGGIDIFYSKLEDSRWSEPKAMLPPINSEEDDTNPLLSPTGDRFYFSSNRDGGQGGYDVYMSSRDGYDKAWKSPSNMGTVINTPSNEKLFTIPNLGANIFVSRGEDLKEKIYEAKLPYVFQPAPVVLVYGRVIDDQTREPKEDVPIEIILVNKPVKRGFNYYPARRQVIYSSAGTGDYSAILLAGAEYDVRVNFRNYRKFEKPFNLTNIYKTTEKKFNISISNRLAIEEFAGIYFQTKKTGLTDEAKVSLRLYIAFLKEHSNYIILLAGYADRRGPSELNRSIAKYRAENVRDYLIKQGVSANRIFTSVGGIKGSRRELMDVEKMQYYRTVQIRIVKQ